MTKIIQWIKNLFTSQNSGVLLKKLIKAAGTQLVKDMLNEEYQKKALEFVKQLNQDKTKTNSEKRKEFNEQMFEWAKKEARRISESVVNFLREWAVNAIKAELMLAKGETEND